MNSFKLISPAFEQNKNIPVRFSCKGADIAPPLTWQHAPATTKSFALICDDPDAPKGTWVHWVVYNLPANITSLSENSNIASLGGIEGINSSNKNGYNGPCPPSGTHRYFFKLYAVDTMLTLKPGATKEELLQALQGHIVGEAELMGTFSK